MGGGGRLVFAGCLAFGVRVRVAAGMAFFGSYLASAARLMAWGYSDGLLGGDAAQRAK